MRFITHMQAQITHVAIIEMMLLSNYIMAVSQNLL